MPAPFPRAEPQSAGFSPDRLARMRTVLTGEVERGNIPGAVVAIVRGGKLVHLDAIGHRDPTTREPMTTDAIFSIASMTKVMTSAAIMMAHEEGRLLLGDPVSRYVPELAELAVADGLHATELRTRAPTRIPTIQDLLRHTSGLCYGDRGTSAAHKLHPPATFIAAQKLTKEEFIARLAKAPLLFDPGSNWEYGTSTEVLGFVLEAIEKKPLEQVLAARIWGPLGMADTSFHLPEAKRGRYALALARDPLTGDRQSIVHAGTHAFKWGPGGAAAVATASDFLRFAEMLRAGGALGSTRLMGTRTVRQMTSDHLPAGLESRIADSMDPAATGYGFGLGVAVRRADGGSAMTGSAGDFYWSGVFGTYFWVDPREELTVVFMAAAPGMIRMRYRQLTRGLVYQAMT